MNILQSSKKQAVPFYENKDDLLFFILYYIFIFLGSDMLNSRNLKNKVTTIVYYLKNSSFSIVILPILLLEYELPLYLCQSVKTVSNSSSDFFCTKRVQPVF